jgi:hypothetical protein
MLPTMAPNSFYEKERINEITKEYLRISYKREKQQKIFVDFLFFLLYSMFI